jgi:signal transduction histidine kinase
MKWAMRAGVLLAIVLAVVSAGILVRRALAPVKRITETARSIEESSDLSRRVNYKGPPDEIGQLASTFDHMIEHLYSSFQSQKDFVADASHELRGPLTVFKGNLDLLKRNLSEEDRKESLSSMEAETLRMKRIVDDLLLLAEIESGRKRQQEKVSLIEIIEEGLNRGQQLAGNRKITIVREEKLTVKGDTHRLRQLLINLVNNAIRYTADNGTITLSLFREGDYACLQVADTGIGIEPEHIDHIFDRFYRTDKARSRAKGGIGLGLAIVKVIAEQHGGKVTVTSEPGKGSVFTVWLKL